MADATSSFSCARDALKGIYAKLLFPIARSMTVLSVAPILTLMTSAASAVLRKSSSALCWGLLCNSAGKRADAEGALAV